MIIVTGASGFIGRRLSLAIARRFPLAPAQFWLSPETSLYERQGKGIVSEMASSCPEVDLLSITGNCFPPRSTKDQLIIFHLAANTSTAKSYQSVNDCGTERLLNAIGPLSSNDHFIFTSTVAVMDNRRHLDAPIESFSVFMEEPLTPYGQSKLRAEQLLERYSRRWGFRLTIVRLMTVYGSQPKPKSFLWTLLQHVRRCSILCRVNWPGKTGLVHVDDVVEALIILASERRESQMCSRYLLNGETRTLAEVSELLHCGLGIEYKPFHLPRFIWTGLWKCWCFVKALRSVLPGVLFNPFWRAHLIMGSVFWSDSKSLHRLLGHAPRTIEETMRELLEMGGTRPVENSSTASLKTDFYTNRKE